MSSLHSSQQSKHSFFSSFIRNIQRLKEARQDQEQTKKQQYPNYQSNFSFNQILQKLQSNDQSVNQQTIIRIKSINDQFQDMGFENNQQALLFQQYLQTQEQRKKKQNKQKIKKKKIIVVKTRDYDESEQNKKYELQREYMKIKYIERHLTPVTTFNYHGIDIRVIYQRYQNYNGTILVLPFTQINPRSIHNLTKEKQLAKYLLYHFDQKKLAQYQQKCEIPFFFCKNIFKNKNYKHLYLIRQPNFKYMPEYAAKKLSQYVANLLSLCCSYKTTQNIVFHGFEWIGLDGKHTPQTFFWKSLEVIYAQVTNKDKINLNRITICCDNQNTFFNFTYALRQISDMYMRSGMISL